MIQEIQQHYSADNTALSYERWGGDSGGNHYGYFDLPIAPGKRPQDIPNLHNQSLQKMERKVVDFLDHEKAQVVLDLGCGDGSLLSLLDNHSRTVIGVNVVDRQLQRAQQRIAAENLNAFTLKADFHELPMEDGVADRIVFLESFNHSREKLQALSEAYRVLNKNGGQILIAEPMLVGRNHTEETQQHLEQISLGKKVQVTPYQDLIKNLEEMGLQTVTVDITKNVRSSMMLASNAAADYPQNASVHLDAYNHREATKSYWQLMNKHLLGYFMVRATARS